MVKLYNISRFVGMHSYTGHNFINQVSSNFVKVRPSSFHSITSNQSMHQIQYLRNQSNHLLNLCKYQLSNYANSGNQFLEQFNYSSNQFNHLLNQLNHPSNHHSYYYIQPTSKPTRPFFKSTLLCFKST